MLDATLVTRSDNMSSDMNDPIVLLHGSANGSYSWGAIAKLLAAAGKTVFAVDMLGYGASPRPSTSWTVEEEVKHLVAAIDARGFSRFHLVTHSLGTFFGLHLRLALGERVTRLTLVDPLLLNVLGDDVDARREAWDASQAFLDEKNFELAGRGFVDHWNGAGAWESIGPKARATIAALVPKVALEILAARADETPLAKLAASPPPTLILVGEKTKLAPRAVTRHLERVFAARVVEVAGAGHMIPLTHPRAVVEALAGVRS